VSLRLDFEQAASLATAVGVFVRLACRKTGVEGDLAPAFGRWQVVNLVPGIRELGLVVEWCVVI
jgi:hypothetical protein